MTETEKLLQARDTKLSQQVHKLDREALGPVLADRLELAMKTGFNAAVDWLEPIVEKQVAAKRRAKAHAAKWRKKAEKAARRK